LKIRSNQFELVICTGVLTSGHVGPKAIKELIRIVKPKGFFICSIAETIFKKNGFQEQIESLSHISKLKFTTKRFIALPNNRNSAKSKLYVLQKLS
jgi:ubiquinone/menaquinone biosynthesis C-methylase UbiE